MHLLALILGMYLIGGARAQEASAEEPVKLDAPKKHKLLIAEVAVAPAVADMPLDELAANYDVLRKSGDCTERRSFQLTVWEDREFDFVQLSEITLMTNVSGPDGKVTRVGERVRLGVGLRALLSSDNGKMTLKLDYQNAFIDELAPNTKPSDLKVHSASTNVEIAARKRLAIPIEKAHGSSVLLVTLLTGL